MRAPRRAKSSGACRSTTSKTGAGASAGAAFIGTFVNEDQVWAHLDIAGVDATDEPLPTMPKGFTGWGVRVLDEYLRRHHE